MTNPVIIGNATLYCGDCLEMNDVIYNFHCAEHEGEFIGGDLDEGCSLYQALNAEVRINREPESEQRICLDIWYSFLPDEGRPENDPFNEKTAIALRDFLIFCFPLK